MACKNVNIAKSEEADIPRWKKELINEKKTFGRTISTASGLAKLTVTCPRKMRSTIKKQMSLPNHEVSKNNDFAQKENDTDFITMLQQLHQGQNGDCVNDEKTSTSLKTKISKDENNFPKPGIVQSLKSRYMSLIKDDKYQLTRHSTSLEILDSENSLQEENQAVGNCKNNILELETKEHLPAADTVKQTKKLFEPTAEAISTALMPRKQIRSLSTTNGMTLYKTNNLLQINNLETTVKQLKLHEKSNKNQNCKPKVKPKPVTVHLLSHRKVTKAHKSSQTSPESMTSRC